MSRKYIRQIINRDFVYPNNEVSEYDVELVQDLNENSVSGIVTNFTATTVTTTGMTFSHNYTWLLNNAEPWIRNSNVMAILSVHAMVPNQLYYKPWRVVDTVSINPPFLATFSGTNTFFILPSNFGLTTFVNGTYYFEIRFIGHRSIFPVCVQYNITTL
jgi:hypothetical protein